MPQGPPPRIYFAHHGLVDPGGGLFEHVASLGLDHLLLSPIFKTGRQGDVFAPLDHDRAETTGEPVETAHRIARLSEGARAHGLRLLMDLDLERFDAEHPLVRQNPEIFAFRRIGAAEDPVDPRKPLPPHGLALARLRDPAARSALMDWFRPRLHRWLDAGLDGFRIIGPERSEAAFWCEVIAELRGGRPNLTLIADTPGAPRPAVLDLADCGFDYLISSVAWWDGRARWLVEEHEALRRVAPLIAAPEAPYGPRLATRGDLRTAYAHALAVAAASGSGLLLPMGFEHGARAPLRTGHAPAPAHACGGLDLSDEVRAAALLSAELSRFDGEMRLLTGPGAPATALLRATGDDVRTAEAALLVLINPDLGREAPLSPQSFLAAAGGVFEPFERLDNGGDPYVALAPGEVRLLGARRGRPVTLAVKPPKPAAKAAARGPRLVVEEITPRVDGGPFAVKRVVGEEVVVEADIYADGHEQLAAEVRWRALDGEWSAVRMEPLGNDRWRGRFPLERLGRHEFVVEGWLDRFGGYRRDLRKKLEAGVAQEVDLQEGRALLADAAERNSDGAVERLRPVLKAFDKADPARKGEILLDPNTAALMDDLSERPFRLCSDPPQLLDAERLQARFASWYELFPRSMTDDAARHGTFDDVIARLPAVREMGFDVLYFPPIHPIGTKHRKGRNNSLTAGPDDPGSPYAIGSDEGGHDAIHPQLGSFEDFRRLVAAARQQGLEIALDFAIQCSPDHPWIREHPDWFDWRPDGTIKYAENPPKKYQDIVNVDFFKQGAIPDLWVALRDVVLLWVREGVKTFRVDNPHTKPFAFWEWMIRDVRAAHPDVVFLSEAFTRPKVMYRLAKAGFSQSYTYFTWRHTKQEFTDYLTELSTTPPKEFFRPHFFVNTPDINPYFLQTTGRAGHLIRAVLAATLSGLWGVYAGFELLDATPLAGKEEYLDSEKYEIRPRNWTPSGSIVPQITQLNRLRRSHPALQTHLNVEFLPASSDQILAYAKLDPSGAEMIIVAVNLDPHGPHAADLELPFWRLGVDDHGSLAVEDLLTGAQWDWKGKWQHVSLDPGQPYAIWRLEARS